MIHKRQMGGVVFTPPTFQDYSTKADSPQQQAATKSGKQSNPFVDSEDLKELAGKGLANDVTAFADKVNKNYQLYMQMSDSEKSSPIGRRIAASLSGDIAELNALERRKEHFTDSLKAAKDNKAESAYAITGNNFVVKKNGQIGVVSFDQYSKDRENGALDYNILTVGDLAREREFNPSLTDDTSVFSIIGQTKGIQFVYDEIKNVINNATGENKEEAINQRLLTKQEADALENLVGTLQGGTYSSYEEIMNSGNAQQLQTALSTLTSNLDSSSIQTIKAQLIANGSNPDNLGDDFNNYLLSLVSPRIKSSNKKQTKLTIEDSNTSGGAGKGKGSENAGIYELAFTGRGDIESLTQMNTGSGVLNAVGAVLPPTISRDDKDKIATIDKTPILKTGDLSKAFTYDGKPIEPNRTIITGNTYVTEVPVIMNRDGGYEIDKSSIDSVAEYRKKVREAGLNKDEKDMNQTEKLKLKTLKSQYNIDRGIKTIKVMVANATSYDLRNDFRWPWLERNNNPLYSKPTGDELRALEEAVPEDDPAKTRIDAVAWDHLIFIPTRGQMAFRDLDGNQLKIDKELVTEDSYTTASGSRVLPKDR